MRSLKRVVAVAVWVVIAGTIFLLAGILAYGALTEPQLRWPERVAFLIADVLFLLYAVPEWVLPNPDDRTQAVSDLAGHALVALIAFGGVWAFLTAAQGPVALRAALTTASAVTGLWATRSAVVRFRKGRHFPVLGTASGPFRTAKSNAIDRKFRP